MSTTTCRGSDFTGAFNEGQGAAGTIYASVTLTKVRRGAAPIKGWPILTLQDKLGAVAASTVDQPNADNPIQFIDRANHAPTLVSLHTARRPPSRWPTRTCRRVHGLPGGPDRVECR